MKTDNRNATTVASAQAGYLYAEDGKPERTNMNLYGVLKKTTVHGRPTIFETNTPFSDAEDACKAKGLKLAASTYCEGYKQWHSGMCSV